LHEAAALLEPHAGPQQDEYKRIHAMVVKTEMQNDESWWACILVLHLLGARPFKQKKNMKDMVHVFCNLCPFFKETAEAIQRTLSQEDFDFYQKSLLFKQEERALRYPDTRSHHSTPYRDVKLCDIWCNLDEPIHETAPEEFDNVTRPIIAKLLKANIITPACRPPKVGNEDGVVGFAVARTEPGRNKLDMYIDMTQVWEMEYQVAPKDLPNLREQTAAWSTKHPEARFSVLRIWSCAYFYPCMIGLNKDQRQYSSFMDARGRCWDWKFVPKDMGYSEMSIMLSIMKTLNLYKKELKLGTQVIVRRDIILVLGKSEQDCMMLTMAATFAVQARPWLREVDLWKSFVNVDAEFIKGLDGRWIE
jgi:hypothetical protein